MSQPIQSPEVGNALQRLFSLVGRVRPSLEEYVIPVVNVGNVDLATEPPVAKLCAAAGLTTSIAPDFPTIRIECPAGVTVRLRGLFVRGSTSAALYGSFAAIGAISNLIQPVYTDARNAGEPWARTYDGDAITIGAADLILSTVISTTHVEIPVDNIILSAGEGALRDFVQFQFSNAGGSFYWTLLWEEFPHL